MISRILITGAAGLVGTATRTAFENQGWKVSTLDQREQDLDGRPIEHVCNILTTDLKEKLLNIVELQTGFRFPKIKFCNLFLKSLNIFEKSRQSQNLWKFHIFENILNFNDFRYCSRSF